VPPVQRVLRSETVRRLSCWLIHLYIRLVYRTGRWTVEGAEIPRGLVAEGKPIIVAFWHGRLLMLPLAWQKWAPFYMLISGHRDGRIIAGAVHYFGIESIAGSSNAGGGAALRAIVRHIKHGDVVGITPDGPNGPAMRASGGIVAAARLARAQVVPLTYATARRRVLASWDRFHLPFPWTRGIMIWGEPIAVPAELDADGAERWRRLIEERMIAQTAEADRRVGREATAPGTLGREELRALRRAAPGGGI
jgi:lysophospholipid acyltransferase (LPLAT)-like uncharacterized protein